MSLDKTKRTGVFTSSEIAALMSEGTKAGTLGKPALTYIQEKNIERRLGRPLETDNEARPAAWGNLCENLAFNLLPTTYRLCSKETLSHPNIKFWVGTPDVLKEEDNHKTVSDIKCPFTLKSFCTLVDAWKKGGIEEIRKSHRDGEKFYWQLISNACITGAEYGELIVYCPYLNDLHLIRELVEGNADYYWVWVATDEELPYLPEGGYYQSLNVMRFEIPDRDRAALTARVLKAGEDLVPYYKPKLITQ